MFTGILIFSSLTWRPPCLNSCVRVSEEFAEINQTETTDSDFNLRDLVCLHAYLVHAKIAVWALPLLRLFIRANEIFVFVP